MHFSTAQSRSAWTEQEDELLRIAVAKYGDRAWATVANDVPGRSSKSCSDRWRNFLSPDIEHPRKSPFTEWEVAVVVQAQERYGNNWKAISMLLPGRTNRAVKNLFVGNLKWGARLQEIRNQYLEEGMSLEALLEIKPDHAGGPPRPRGGAHMPTASGSPTSMRAASTSSAGSAWASDMTEQPLSGSPASAGTHHHHGHHHSDRRKRGEQADNGGGQSPQLSKRRRAIPSPVVIPHGGAPGCASSYSPSVAVSAPHPGALGASGLGLGLGRPGSPSLLGVADMGPPTSISAIHSGLVGVAGMGCLEHPASAPASLYLAAAGGPAGMLAARQRVSGHDACDPAAGMLLPGSLGLNIGANDEMFLEPSASGMLGNAGYMCPSVSGQPQRLQVPGSGLPGLPGLPSSLGAGAGLHRSNSLPGSQGGAGFAGLLGGAQAGMLVGRVASWHPGGPCVGGDGAVMTAMGSSPFAPFAGAPQQQQQQQVQQQPRILMPGTGLPSLTCATGRPSIKPEPSAEAGSEQHGYGQQHTQQPGTWPVDMAAQQQQQQQQQQQYGQQQLYGQQQQQQYGGMLQQQPVQAAAAGSGGGAACAAAGAQSRLGQPHVVASIASAAGLAIPGSPPALPPAELNEMKSNDSAALQQMLDVILYEAEDDPLLSDPTLDRTLDKLLPDASHGLASMQHHHQLMQQQQQQQGLAPATPAAQHHHLAQHGSHHHLLQQQQQQARQQVLLQAADASGAAAAPSYSHRSWEWVGADAQQQQQQQQQQLMMHHQVQGQWAAATGSSWGQQQQQHPNVRQQYQQVNQQLQQENLVLQQQLASIQNRLGQQQQQQGQDRASDAANSTVAAAGAAAAEPRAAPEQQQQQQQQQQPSTAVVKQEVAAVAVAGTAPVPVGTEVSAVPAGLPPLGRAPSIRPMSSLGGGLSGGGWCPRLVSSSGGGLRLSEAGSAGGSLMAMLGKDGSMGGANLLESCGIGATMGVDDMLS